MKSIVIDDTVETLPDFLRALRYRYATHEQIIELASTHIDNRIQDQDKRDHWQTAIERHLEMIVDDLGNCSVDSWDGARNSIMNGPYLETCPNSESLQNALTGPAICLAAGPTAQHQLARVRHLQDTHHIFTVDAMAQACQRHGIMPHFTALLERTPQNCDMLAGTGSSGSRLLALPVIDPRAAAAYRGKVLWWMGSGLLNEWLAPGRMTAYSGKSCGVMSVAAALLAGCNPIYLVGHDLAYENGRSHSESVHPTAPVEHGWQNRDESFIYYGRRFQAEANAGGTVETCGLWQQFRHDIEHLISQYPDRTVINCGGLAKINGTVMGCMRETALMAREPEWQIVPIRNWLAEKSRIIQNIQRIKDACMAADGTDPQRTAESFAISKFVDADLARLFNYVFRPISENLKMRLHYRVSRGAESIEQQARALRLMVNTIYHLCCRMEADLQ